MSDGNTGREREKKLVKPEEGEGNGKDHHAFGYGDAALLVILFGYLAECLGVSADTNRDIDIYVFLKGIPMLFTSVFLAIKGRKSPGSIAVYLIGGFYFLFFILVLLVRVFR